MSLESVMKDINKKFKSEVLTTGMKYEEIERVPFPSPRLNYMTYGGIPRGRAIEFFGSEGGGKTTTSLIFCGEYQKAYPEKKVVFVDLENTFDDRWATINGVNTEDLVMFRPNNETAEEILQAVIDIVSSDEVSLLVLDSIPMLVPKQLYDQDVEKKAFGGVSIPISEFCRRISPKLYETNTTLILINQVRDNLKNPFDIYHSPGGRALKHLCALRLFFRKGSFIDDKCTELNNNAEEPAGNLVDMRVIKNKASRNDRRLGQYTLKYKDGIDVMSDTVFMAIKFGIIKQAGAWFSMMIDGEEIKTNGKAKLVEHLETQPEAFADLSLQVHEALIDHDGIKHEHMEGTDDEDQATKELEEEITEGSVE